MNDPMQFAAAQVPFLIYDLWGAGAVAPMREGFYWSLALPEDPSEPIIVEGPLATRQQAIDEATAFIKDALTPGEPR